MIIKTKLYAPKPKLNFVFREGLGNKLEQINHTKLTLVSAPAGFGKSHLIAGWCSIYKGKFTWLSLDVNDKNTDTFFYYLVAAFREVDCTLAQEAWDLVQLSQGVSKESVIRSLLNELTYYENDVTLILDDYHLASSPEIDKIIDNFICLTPPNVHTVLITRSDPSISLARLRANGDLTEFRAADLRFTDEEAMELLKKTCSTKITEKEVTTVNSKTEGWAVGLQLFSLALNNNKHPNKVISALSGAHSYVIDYLTEQVLTGVNKSIRHFLRETYFLKEFSVDLCDFILDTESSEECIAYLDSNNVFLIPLDNERGWFRYHHLFSDVLRIHTPLTENRLQQLKWRAAVWLADRGRLADAVQYARDCGANKLLGLIEHHWPTARATSHDSLLLEWLASFDIESIKRFRVLAGYYGLALLPRNPEQGLYLINATRLFFEQSDKPLSENENTTLGVVNIGQAYVHAAQNNTKEVLGCVRSALNVLPMQEHVWRGSSRALEGIALWRDGDTSGAEYSLKAALADMDRSQDISAKITSRFLLGDFYYQFGWLNRSKTVVKSALEIIDQSRSYTIEGSADLYLLCSEIEFEQGNIEEALNLLDTARQFGTLGSMPETKYRYPLIEGRIALAENRIKDALKSLSDADTLYAEPPNPCHKPPLFWKAIVLLSQGNDELVRQQVHFSNSFYSNPFNYLVYALVQPNETDRVLDSIGKVSTHHTPPVIQFASKLVSAIKAESSGDKKLVEDILKQVALLVTENNSLMWLREIKVVSDLFIKYKIINQKQTPAVASSEALIESLSPKEEQVLLWLDTELSGPQIASKLFVSLNTLRTHTKNIYSKLGVNNRRAAVNKSRSLKLIP
ncbi:LuxR C-terminal-related transcriptional regulator [Vibrio sinaloensis]|uniref:LuxR C-terminal-related transcriptional regulator n=1 Tax=Photobacterium sp. (strain ATCC 43367) TaxID=379097 RepID=UPI00206957D6|nr:LuxR C-terminal-related transcriptional regulator [Vibrio sinaloensis]UPQ89145.1 LuxR C-terminal-related transcriptional regulator [Vibrio sinaloensis]